MVWLTLKQPRIKPVLRALPQIQQGRSLRDVINIQRPAIRDDFYRRGREPALQDLGFHRTHNVQAHGGGEDAPKTGAKWPNGSSVTVTSKTFCAAARNARPCNRLARLAT